MTTARKHKKVKGYDVDMELAKVKQVFQSINDDESLPTFLNFFLECLITGTAENVNLKTMYPGVYRKLNTLLQEHKANILAMRK